MRAGITLARGPGADQLFQNISQAATQRRPDKLRQRQILFNAQQKTVPSERESSQRMSSVTFRTVDSPTLFCNAHVFGSPYSGHITIINEGNFPPVTEIITS
jgi:hypothetical protein